MKRFWLVTLMLASFGTCVLLIISEAFACVLALPKFQVPPTFSVEVVHRNTPVKGLKVVISRRSDLMSVPVREGLTNEHGTFVIEQLPQGKYDLEVGSNSAFGNLAEIEVTPKRTPTRTELVRLTWLMSNALSLKRFHGILKQSTGNATQPSLLRGIRMEVADARSQKLIASLTTDLSGHFDLSGLSPGLYEVRIKPRLVRLDGRDYALTGGGTLPLEIISEHDVSERPVDLVIWVTDCGLGYEVIGPEALKKN